MKKNIVILIIILVVLVLGFWFLSSRTNAPSGLEEEGQPNGLGELDVQSDAVINQDLDSVDLGDLNEDFDSINQDLNNL